VAQPKHQPKHNNRTTNFCVQEQYGTNKKNEKKKTTKEKAKTKTKKNKLEDRITPHVNFFQLAAKER